MRFERYIEKFRTSSKKAFNFQTIIGGVYNFPCKHMFFKQFCQAYPKFNESYATSLVFRPRKDIKMPMYLDFDFKMKVETRIPTTALLEVCRKIFKFLGEEPQKFLLTRRNGCYYKETKSESYWKSGFHLWVFGKYSTQTATDLRLKCLEAGVLDSFLKDYQIYNKPSDVYDGSPAIRSNGLLLVGDRKLGVKCSPHFICYYSMVGELEYGWQFADRPLFLKLLAKMYSFIWEPQQKIKICTKSQPKICSAVKPIAPHQDEEKLNEDQKIYPPSSKFNIKAFLEATKGYVPQNEAYKQLCAYFASQGLDPRATCTMCNSYWCYTTRETETLMRKAVQKQDFRVTKASVISILQDHATQAWGECEIFGELEPRYYNEYLGFMQEKSIHPLSEVVNFLKGVCQYAYRFKKYTWLDFTTTRDKLGNELKALHRKISKDPFYRFRRYRNHNFSLQSTVG